MFKITSFIMGNQLPIYLGKRDWAKSKMEEAVKKGDLNEAQKFHEIAAAYDHAANMRVQKRPGW